MSDKIQMVHGSGGRATGELIHSLFADEFQNETLDLMEDSAVLAAPEGMRIAFTTDSFVVTPTVFRGGDIGRLAVAGTVNDLLMRGAQPKYLTCAAILEEGLDIDLLRTVIHSMANTAREAGVQIVAGDTKVVEASGREAGVQIVAGDTKVVEASGRGTNIPAGENFESGTSGETPTGKNNSSGGLFLNTSGIGFVPEELDISAGNAKRGDVIIVSGTMGDHHAAILSARLGMENSIRSDAAPLVRMVTGLIDAGVEVHTLRDVTRGGLGTVLKELADASGCTFDIEEEKIPVRPQVRDFCGLLGLDPLYMGNEGKLVAIVSRKDADRALEIIRGSDYGENAAVIGTVRENTESRSTREAFSGDSMIKKSAPIRGEGEGSWKPSRHGTVILHTPIGGRRILDVLEGEGLPRIC